MKGYVAVQVGPESKMVAFENGSGAYFNYASSESAGTRHLQAGLT